MPKISVVIPFYNSGAFLRDTLESVRAQTFPDMEIIVVDDGSTENVMAHVPDDTRIRMIRQPNRGLSMARNAGIAEASGEYVAFIDADDLWLPEKLAKQIALMESTPAAAICHTACAIINQVGEEFFKSFYTDATTFEELITGKVLCVSSVLARRSMLLRVGLFDPLLRSVQDHDLWLKLSAHFGVVYLPEVLTRYRVHGSNMSGNVIVMQREINKVTLSWLEVPFVKTNATLTKAIRRNLDSDKVGWGCVAFNAARAAYRRREWSRFKEQLLIAWELAPWFTVCSMARFVMAPALGKQRK